MDYTVVVNASAAAPASFKYIAPYSGAAIGAHWMYQRQHALIVYDDLSKQADAYRSSPCCSAGPRAARPTRATCSTSTPGCSSGRQAVR